MSARSRRVGAVLALGWLALAAGGLRAAEDLSGAAALRDWVQPAYPPEAARQRLEGRVVVEFSVGEDGKVTDAAIAESDHGLFEEAALDAVRRWTFSPALENGVPVASGMRVPIEFRLAQLKQRRVPVAPPQHLMPQPARRTPAKALDAPDPHYPEELEERKLPGQVLMRLTVGVDGRVRRAEVRWASHPAFVEESLRAAEASRFEPARQGTRLLASELDYPVNFASFGARRADMLAANGIELAEGESAEVLPEPFALADVVHPFDALRAGREGEARVEFTVSADGEVTGARVVAASEPEQGAALLAAVEGWVFRPAMRGGERVPIKLTVTHAFTRPTAGNEGRLAAALLADLASVGSARGLDAALKPLWRGFPLYPPSLAGERATGSATIEFIVDRGGRARWPRIVAATRPEFGWAAATAVQQWVFARPLRQGEPTDARVSVEISFTPPAP